MTLFIIGFIALRVLCVAFLVVLVLRIMAGARRRHVDAALAALGRRYVSGGLSESDFRHMREVLES